MAVQDPQRVRRSDESDDVTRARGAVRNTASLYERRRPPTGWQGFVARYGWRAYALPILIIVTVVALFTAHNARKAPAAKAGSPSQQRAAAPSTPPPAAASQSLKDDGGGKIDPTALAAAALPAGPAYTVKGDGTFTMLKGSSPVVGKGKLYRYSIEVEKGVTGINLTQFQQLVVSTLSDKRSWSGHGVSLQRVDHGPIDFRVSLTSSMTVRKLCGYTIPVETSCYDPVGSTTKVNRVVLNDARYVRGASAYLGDPAQYRIYMINHEDGHALGHEHAHQCLPDGLAPAMMQQTFGLRSTATGAFCRANPWPYPTGVAGAPGAEQQDTAKNDEYGQGD